MGGETAAGYPRIMVFPGLFIRLASGKEHVRHFATVCKSWRGNKGQISVLNNVLVLIKYTFEQLSVKTWRKSRSWC